MERILVSACLLGHAVRYNAQDQRCADGVLQRWVAEGRVVSVCPEVAGGLPVPRPPAEITGGAGGAAVLARTARVVDQHGADVSTPFLAGADQALATAQAHGIRVAVLKDGSPSCGSTYSYDGTFTAARVPYPGVTAARLQAAGVRVFSDTQLADADLFVHALERAAATP
ncbi:MAG: DUF523 domain-containing protein [Acidobacteria bacterium]|nr:DUF523 domain-containing protein [Acidobacteriota bacterium]